MIPMLRKKRREGSSTLQLGHVHAELVPLLQHPLAPLLDKGIESRRELGHAIAQVVEAKVDAGQRVGERQARRWRAARRERWLEYRRHFCADYLCVSSWLM